ncbi:hypothetical protein GA0115250_102635 [Streptomyces sp. BvitLS-983]|nr:hypothetical protein GA0115250_102635 [Streptomyces sp. BvitLS-983]
MVVVEGAGGRQHHHPGARVGGGEFGRLVGGLHRVGEHPLKGVHVGLGDLVRVGAAPDRPGPVDHQPGADGGRVAALRVGLAPPLEPVVVLLGQFLEDFQARPAFVPVLPGRLDVGGGLLPLPPAGAEDGLDEGVVAGVGPRRPGHFRVELGTGHQAVQGGVEHRPLPGTTHPGGYGGHTDTGGREDEDADHRVIMPPRAPLGKGIARPLPARPGATFRSGPDTKGGGRGRGHTPADYPPDRWQTRVTGEAAPRWNSSVRGTRST